MKVLVIGSGIVGVSAAYHLSFHDVEVVLIDRKEPGQATKAAAGIICPWASQRRNKAWYALASAGAAYYPELIRMLEEDGEHAGYKKAGALAVDSNVQKLEKKAALLAERRKTAPEIGDVTLLDTEQTIREFPLLAEECQAVHIAGGAKVQGSKLRDALEQAAVKRGVKVICGSAAPFVEEGNVKGVTVNEEIIRGDQLIVAAGAWANEFTKPLGKDLQIYGQKAQLLHLQGDCCTDDWPVIMPPGTQYIVPFEGGRFAAGATFEDSDDFSIQSTAGGVLEILQKALLAAPALSKASITEVRVGIRPHTPNFMPVIGALPGYPNIWIANGLGSSGLTVGPLIGKLLSQLARGEETGWDLGSYRIEQIIANDD